ncbi:hypothetical protein P170DRAFT_407100 [Aspergillus steynii IBT 23096]|uniref:Rhodopsin domain-containing protein n=1 Tax=Aspergillus steynii IBT 23096 TaxID=1392250 RepID=A0A2I2GEK1_9EURO|nr:uncharacterized protein P170DRAFT_407100 [Aspergillus steynii IBT 23096]PLB51304.1 hypothetical protein P170DRAFT_407100 [Aspergillus steynii IBT 23096]
MSNIQESSGPSLVTTSLLVVAIVFPILGSIAVALRLYSSLSKHRRLFADDYVALLAVIAAWGISIDMYVAAALAGVNTATTDPLSATVVFLRALWIEGFPLISSLVLVKTSLLMFYARIFVTPSFRLAVWIYISILVAWGIAIFVAQLLTADPITAAWNPMAKDPLRYDYNTYSIAFAAMSMVFDIIVLCFPIPVIYKLQMSGVQKLQVLGIFWLGIFCCVSSAIRFYYIYSDIRKSVANTGPDRYTASTTATTWAIIEPNMSIVAACLPTYANLFGLGQGLRSVIRSVRSFLSTRGAGGGSSGGNTSLGSIAKGNSVIVQSSATGEPHSPKRPSSRQFKLLGVGKGDGDVELGERVSSDHIPLTANAQQMNISVTKTFESRGSPARGEGERRW